LRTLLSARRGVNIELTAGGGSLGSAAALLTNIVPCLPYYVRTHVTPPTDEQLLQAYLAGDAGSFESLVRRYSEELYRFLARFVGNASVAEDIVQDTFLQVHLSGDRFDMSRRFKPWLFAIAANKGRDWLRARGRHPELPLDASADRNESDGRRFADFLQDPAALPLDQLATDEQRALVQDIVQGMPTHLREVLIMGYFHKFPYKEMAEVIGIPLGTVKSRLHAAIRFFAEQFEARLRPTDTR
jgi:RNA polymerase sigma-70 factor (ECF subfamily)